MHGVGRRRRCWRRSRAAGLRRARRRRRAGGARPGLSHRGVPQPRGAGGDGPAAGRWPPTRRRRRDRQRPRRRPARRRPSRSPTAAGGALGGDEIGWLLADHVLATHAGDDRLVVTTLVSSSLLSTMAAAEGVHYAETLTGFKWIARAVARPPGAAVRVRLRAGARLPVDAVGRATRTASPPRCSSPRWAARRSRRHHPAGSTRRHRRPLRPPRLAEHSLRLDPAEMSAFMDHLRA